MPLAPITQFDPLHFDAGTYIENLQFSVQTGTVDWTSIYTDAPWVIVTPSSLTIRAYLTAIVLNLKRMVWLLTGVPFKGGARLTG